MRWTPGSSRPVTLVTEPGGPVVVVDHEELDAIARALAKTTADVIREHLHVEPDADTWCPICQIESLH
jgi:hypothetical protein